MSLKYSITPRDVYDCLFNSFRPGYVGPSEYIETDPPSFPVGFVRFHVDNEDPKFDLKEVENWVEGTLTRQLGYPYQYLRTVGQISIYSVKSSYNGKLYMVIKVGGWEELYDERAP